MSIRLEQLSSKMDTKITPGRLFGQGTEIFAFVGRQGHWLDEQQPGTRQRNRDGAHSIYNPARMAHSEKLNAYLVRHDKAVVGLATIIFDQGLIHPEKGLYRGNDLDYIIEPGASTGDHAQVILDLLVEHRRLNDQRNGELITSDWGVEKRFHTPRKAASIHPAIATVPVGQSNPALGIALAMVKVGDPAHLGSTESGINEEVSRGGALAQLYQIDSIPEPLVP
jgi:hypothetical protein